MANSIEAELKYYKLKFKQMKNKAKEYRDKAYEKECEGDIEGCCDFLSRANVLESFL